MTDSDRTIDRSFAWIPIRINCWINKIWNSLWKLYEHVKLPGTLSNSRSCNINHDDRARE